MSRKRREWRRAVRLRIAAEAIRRETIELAQRKGADLRRRGYTSCPRCGQQWLAPATPEGGPLVPVQLDACPRCGAKDSDAVRRDQKYQAELDAAHARTCQQGNGKRRRAGAAAWFERMEAEGHPVAVRALERDARALERAATAAAERARSALERMMKEPSE